MFAPNPEGERLLVLTLANGLTREQPARWLRRWFRRSTNQTTTVQVPIETEAAPRGGERLVPSRL